MLAGKRIGEELVAPWDFTGDPLYGDYPENIDTDEWWQYDRLLRHCFMSAGVSFDWFLRDKYKLSPGYFTRPRVEQSQEPELAVTLAPSRYFSGD